jgi:hypothetical protein
MYTSSTPCPLCPQYGVVKQLLTAGSQEFYMLSFNNDSSPSTSYPRLRPTPQVSAAGSTPVALPPTVLAALADTFVPTTTYSSTSQHNSC